MQNARTSMRTRNQQASTDPPTSDATADGADDTGDATPAKQPTLAELQQNLADFSGTICQKLDKISEDVSTINGKIKDLETSVEFNSSKIIEIEQKEMPELKERVQSEISKLDDKITLLEIYNRKPNLLFYGINETQDENIFDTLKNVFVNLGVDEEKAGRIMLSTAHRLPRRNPPPTDQASSGTAPTPIIAKFANLTDRDFILSRFDQKQRQRPSAGGDSSGSSQARITVRTDLPPKLKARRAVLAKVAYRLRKEKGLSTKIDVKGVNVFLQWKEKGKSTWNMYKE